MDSAWGWVIAIAAGIVGFGLSYRLIIWAQPDLATRPEIPDVKDQIYSEIKGKIAGSVGASSNQPGIKEVRERLWQMINYAIGRHDYYERVRRDYLTIALGFMAAATGLEAFLFK